MSNLNVFLELVKNGLEKKGITHVPDPEVLAQQVVAFGEARMKTNTTHKNDDIALISFAGNNATKTEHCEQAQTRSIMSQSEENKVLIDGQTYYGGLNQPNLKFVKVNVNCWEYIFDLLLLRDILAMSQTCQRMRQIGGHYFRENFHGTKCNSSVSGLIYIHGNPIERDNFLRSVDTVEIRSEFELEHLRNASRMNLLGSLTTLRICCITLYENQLHGIENIQTNIETIGLDGCTIGDDSVGEFLASQLNNVGFRSTAAEANFFQRTYPMLERLEYIERKNGDITQLISFLKQNPTMKYLLISVNGLLQIPLDKSTIRLDYLNFEIWNSTDANEILNRLKTLHANGFYKKVRLSIRGWIDGFDGELFFREMASFGSHEFYTNAMDHLTQLEELHLWEFNDGIDLETMATNLINLERLSISGTVDQLSSFVRHSKKLKFVMFNDVNDDFNALQLYNLNEMRKMSGAQRKVQIGFYEKQYLAAKWIEANVDCDLVEITRADNIS